MPKYRLHYFDLRARGELLRLVFAEAGQDFDDKRISFPEWPKLKPTTPFGGVPVLEVDNQRMSQSLCIVRYLAREFKLTGDSNKHEFAADEVVTTMEEFLFKLPFMEQDQKKKMELVKEQLDTSDKAKFNLGRVLQTYESRIAKKGDYFVNNKFTYADLFIYHVSQTVKALDGKGMTSFPKLEAIAERVSQRPKIKKYLASRPSCPF
ncbi:hematopoietic prostaglandin D synthase-like [Clavelina lepadiformis]|uniref:glutathione transferase n=1 Tax=Clavelina lepadiformis TaxID=159417 RepID=A0ABP0F3H6_CLALP